MKFNNGIAYSKPLVGGGRGVVDFYAIFFRDPIMAYIMHVRLLDNFGI